MQAWSSERRHLALCDSVYRSASTDQKSHILYNGDSFSCDDRNGSWACKKHEEDDKFALTAKEASRLLDWVQPGDYTFFPAGWTKEDVILFKKVIHYALYNGADENVMTKANKNLEWLKSWKSLNPELT